LVDKEETKILVDSKKKDSNNNQKKGEERKNPFGDEDVNETNVQKLSLGKEKKGN